MTLSYERILVAIDGSKASEQAFKEATAVAKRNNATLGLVHAIDTRAFSAVTSYDGAMTDKATEYAETLLTEYKESAVKEGLENVEIFIEYGSPKTVISREIAKKFKADLIMCGATGLNAVERLLVGSVTEYVIRHAPCDVLIVRGTAPDVETV
ncbi:universal stress protein [Brochothrix thermosphacta]|uniref:universal stress protein n=1 Tax=Brochothrix thermosphacta TaxID=2756 RepID=UPI0003E877F8|nr:universal stress protein [Brochothrix thermosphacta]EUJ37436.1 putative universal stress protein [Brochothrix thermosphacta DSM 20171 = FSL F6-1036]ODJ48427.1 universal stress protein UspA [Brochothrix thermosphacta DSM 20171 = FSL F6-1036]